MKRIIIFLDLDGVLITSPPWKSDQMDLDGYSKFNDQCISNLNRLLDKSEFNIILSSSRRKHKHLEAFNQIFEIRNIRTPIYNFLPIYPKTKNRREEILHFIRENNVDDFIIIDDDKSLLELGENLKKYLVLTDFLKGFDLDKLEEAESILTRILS